MNAIDFLIKEHNRVRSTFVEINKNSHRDETKRKMFDTLCDELIRHEEMEHKVWYPYFKNDKRLTDTVKHLLVEEKHAEKAIAQFDNLRNQQAWDEKYQKFQRDVEHHAREEEKDLFPQVQKILDEKTLEEIGKEMLQFKKQYDA